MDKLIEDIIELILDDVNCHHEVDHDEGGSHTSVEYNLKHELKVRNKIIALLEPPPKRKSPTELSQEERIEEKVNEMERMFLNDGIRRDKRADREDFIRSLFKEAEK